MLLYLLLESRRKLWTDFKGKMNLEETKRYGINEEEDWAGAFFVESKNLSLEERNGSFHSNGKRIDIYIKEVSGNEPHIHLRDESGNICRIKLRKNEYQRDNYEKNGKSYSLGKDEEKAFREYIHGIVPGTTTMIEWERLAVTWNTNWAMNNKGTGGLVDISKGCPSYLNIQEPK